MELASIYGRQRPRSNRLNPGFHPLCRIHHRCRPGMTRLRAPHLAMARGGVHNRATLVLRPASCAIYRGRMVPPFRMQLMPLPRTAPAASLLLLAFILSGCGQNAGTGAAAPPPPQVTVATPVKRTIVDQDEYVGRFVAVDSVEVRARVSGNLEKVHFEDGQIVKQGDLLFSIDKRPF